MTAAIATVATSFVALLLALNTVRETADWLGPLLLRGKQTNKQNPELRSAGPGSQATGCFPSADR